MSDFETKFRKVQIEFTDSGEEIVEGVIDFVNENRVMILDILKNKQDQATNLVEFREATGHIVKWPDEMISNIA